MKNFFVILTEDQWLTAATFGVIAFSLILITTLNLNLAFFSLVVFGSLGVFRKSFHYGLTFFLIVILVFPSVNLINGLIASRELFVIILLLIGIGSLVLNKHKPKILPIFYYYCVLICLYVGITIFSVDNIINTKKAISVSIFLLTMFVYYVFIILFQYFFQTTRRLERLFLAIIIAGNIQALTIMIFQESSFLSLKEFQLDNLYHSIILAITIPITLGMYLIQSYSLSTIKSTRIFSGRNKIYKAIDVILTKNTSSKELKNNVINLKQTKINMKRLLTASLILQIFGLIVTLSYTVLISVSMGIFIIGVLMRDKRIILNVLGGLTVIIFFFPSFSSTLTAQLKFNILDIAIAIRDVNSWEFIWQGGIYLKDQWIYNTYLFVFGKLGLVGLIVFSLGLLQYFREIRLAYLKSEEFERIWLIIILSIFIEFLFLGIFVNVFLVGPAALLFWILYGILQNLKSRKRKYQLLETSLILNK